MRTRGLLFLFSLPLLSMMNTCEREPAPSFVLPPATQSGANTLGFVVDGRVWREFGVRCTVGGCDTNKIYSDYTHRLPHAFVMGAGQTARNVDERFGLNIEELTGAGVYLATSKSQRLGPANQALRSLFFANTLTNEMYNSGSPGSGKMTISRFDTIQHIISGTFEGVLVNDRDSTKTVKIQDGRFDIRYQN